MHLFGECPPARAAWFGFRGGVAWRVLMPISGKELVSFIVDL